RRSHSRARLVRHEGRRRLQALSVVGPASRSARAGSSMSSTAPSIERVVIDGPAGAIEAMIERPADARADIVAVCCHPHPLYGGTMQNKVVHTLARSCQDQGITSVRFNFRGVGA